uniref:F-box domain-containing protein n=1 Tax=Moniliophthora roreri TaxID=221103 RepID=A0A0W0G8Z6_MONRR
MAVLDKLPTELLLEIISLVSAEEKRTHVTTIKALRLVNRRFYSLTTPFLSFTSIIIKTEHDAPIEEHSNLSSSLNVSTLSSCVRRLKIQLEDDERIQHKINPGAVHRLYRAVSHCSHCVEAKKIQNIWNQRFNQATGLLTSLTSISVSSTVSLSVLWKTLHHQRIQIKDLTVHHRMESELLDYLASYSGLQRLGILCAYWRAPNRQFLLNFFQGVLPKHVESLTTFHISAPWAFGKHSVLYYEQLVNLRHWGVDILVGRNFEKDVLQPCLELAHRLQYLEQLILCPRYHTKRNDQKMDIYASHFVREGIQKTVLSLPPTRAEALQVLVANEQYWYS